MSRSYREEENTPIVGDGSRPSPESPESSDAAEAAETRPWMAGPPRIQRLKDPDAVAQAAAERWLDTASRAVDRHDHFVVVLAGGSTPRLLYRRLAEPPFREKAPWSRTFFVFGDERCVPPDDESSNYRMARETLLEPLSIPDHRVLRMKGEETPVDAARRYEVRLGDLFLTRPKPGFDLVLLGVGADGHTASLFPGTAALDETERWVVANEVPQLGAWRLTLTFPALNSAGRVLFLVTGSQKARIVAEAFGGVEHAESYPCERVAPPGARREVLIDRDAASLLTST